MRYWGEENSHKKKRAPKTSRRKKSEPGKPQSVSEGGTLKNYPFLRELYRHQASISNRLRRLFIFVVVAGLLYAFLLGDGGLLRVMDLRGERSALTTEIAGLEERSALLDSEVYRLKNDAFYIEKIARERYGYKRPGETVYKIIPLAHHDP